MNNKITFNEWFEQLKTAAANFNNSEIAFIPEVFTHEDWEDYYEDGYLPKAALIEDLKNEKQGL